MTVALLSTGTAATIPELLAASARRAPDSPALWRYVDVRFEPVTYRGLLGAAARLADELSRRGAGPGVQIAIAITDRFTWGVAFLGVLFSGATAVPIDPLLKPGEIEAILESSGALVTIHDLRIELGRELKGSSRVPIDTIWPGFDKSADPESIQLPRIEANSLAEIIFTSGTTGTVKGVMLSHGNLVGDIRAIDAMGLLDSEDLLLSILPIHHAFECTGGFLYPLSIGAQVAYARSLKSKEILADLRTTRASVILGVPLLFENIANSIRRGIEEAPPLKRGLVRMLVASSRRGRSLGWKSSGRALLASMRRKAGLDSIRLLVSGGAALPSYVAEYLDTLGLPLMQGYGLTETAPVISVNRPTKYRYDTVGPPLPGTQVKIVNPGSDGVGEIAVAGPMIMTGYWKNPEETAKVLRDGWLLTGDLGIIDPDGHLRICGRSKNVIITGAGKNVYPEEVESVLCARDEILEAVVYGFSKPGKIGETVAAIVVPNADWYRENQPDTWKDDVLLNEAIGRIVKETSELLAPFKRVAQFTIQRDPFEKTSTRKIKRFLVTQGQGEKYASAAALWPRDRG